MAPLYQVNAQNNPLTCLSIVYSLALETEFREKEVGASKVFFQKAVEVTFKGYMRSLNHFQFLYNNTLFPMYRIRQKAPDSCIEFQTSFSIIVGVFCLIISIVVSLSESNCSLYAPDGIRTHETTEVATATSAYALEGQRL